MAKRRKLKQTKAAVYARGYVAGRRFAVRKLNSILRPLLRELSI